MDLGGRKGDIHLIKLEGILFSRPITRHETVAIEDIADEGEPFGFWNKLRPFDEGHRAKSEEGRARLEIPSLSSV